MDTLRLLFGLEQRVTRRTYFVVGVGLMALKLTVDAAVLYLATGHLWRPWDYLSFIPVVASVDTWAVLTLLIWALPFAWIGLSMSVRRSADAGLSPWLGLLFCVPVLNFGVMLLLSWVPSLADVPFDDDTPLDPEPVEMPQTALPLAALRAIAGALLVALVMIVVGAGLIGTLGGALFAGTPLGMGVVAGYLYNRGADRSTKKTLGVAAGALLTAGALLLLFAYEGVICLAMAFPLGLPMVWIGAFMGRSAARAALATSSPLTMVLLTLVLGAWTEPQLLDSDSPHLHSVTTRVAIDAPPEVVWQHVIEFEPLPPPEELWFRLGIAYPTHARLEGRGVGAVRHCEFSTGAFVEPITVWNAPHHLAFDVADQPAPLRELSPYPSVHADHREHSLRSRKGEFRLYASADGGTILEGTTWYELSLYPEIYWALWTDALIGSIHGRVLRHIRSEAEAAG